MRTGSTASAADARPWAPQVQVAIVGAGACGLTAAARPSGRTPGACLHAGHRARARLAGATASAATRGGCMSGGLPCATPPSQATSAARSPGACESGPGRRIWAASRAAGRAARRAVVVGADGGRRGTGHCDRCTLPRRVSGRLRSFGAGARQPKGVGWNVHHDALLAPGRRFPDFRDAETAGALFHTQGRLAFDARCRVLRAGGTALPKLHAAGGAARGVSGNTVSRYLCGNGLLSEPVGGYIAATTALDLLRPPLAITRTLK